MQHSWTLEFFNRVEKEAIKHYNKLLGTIDWDQDTRKVLEKNLADEKEHVKRWEKLISV